MQFFKIALPLALAGSALANPLVRRDDCAPGECLAAVTGKAALGDDGLRADHCKSFLATTVTPEAITTTVTITGVETTTPGWDKWKREQVTVCPNEVPNYASVCDETAYSSACSCFGYSGDSTTTIAATTTTKTVYINPTGTCSDAVKTITVTVSGVPYGTTSTGSTTLAGTSTTTVVVTTCPYSSSTTTVFGSTTTTTVEIEGTSTSTTTVTATASTCPTTSGTATTTTTTTVEVEGTTTTTATTTVTTTASSCPTTTGTATTTTTTTVEVEGTTTTVTTTASSCPTTTGTTTDTTTTTVTTTTTTTPEATCLSQSQVDTFIGNFIDFLSNTDNPVPGGFNYDLAAQVLTADFQDQSDSINYMAGIPLGVTTFDSEQAFAGGQAQQYPVGVQTLGTWVGCKFFSWRYALITGLGENRPIQGINIFEVTDDLTQLKQNYAEFDNAAWLKNIAEAQAAYAAAAGSASTTTTTTDAATTTTTDAATTTTTTDAATPTP